jgi:hypothetical protein
VNGIHEVTGSIPVWSTILRSAFGGLRMAGQSVAGPPAPAQDGSSVARSAKEDAKAHAIGVPNSSESSRNRLAIAATPSVDSLISLR